MNILGEQKKKSWYDHFPGATPNPWVGAAAPGCQTEELYS